MNKTGPTALLFCATAAVVSAANVDAYYQTNLVSDLPGVAAHQDTDLMNPWGIVASSSSPFWVSDNGTGMSTIYNGSGTKQGLVVTLPAASPDPTGIVVNTGSGFGGTHFIFATESGNIAGWAGGTSAALEVAGAGGSVYKGLAIDTAGGHLFAANFGLGRIDIFDSSFAPATVSGNFIDPTLPANYAPFNVQNIGGQLYVTYAKTTGGRDEVDGAGLGLVDVFDLSGHFVKRVASAGGALNAPWGLALAPASGFGLFSGDLLVGNFGDGTINAYNLSTDTFAGRLDDGNGNPLAIDGLWGLTFGNGASSGTANFQDPNRLYFTAGLNGEADGLLGSVQPVPEPAGLPLACIGFASVAVVAVRRSLMLKKQ